MSRHNMLEDKTSGVPDVQDTQHQILDVALRLMQTSGYYAFSYADIAAEVGVTKASIHYHYPSKAQLGHAALRSYRRRWQEQLHALTSASVAQRQDAETLLRGYSRIYRDMIRDGRICLGAALALESPLLPPDIQSGLTEFYSEHEDWLAHVIDTGRVAGVLHGSVSPRMQARGLIAALQGAMSLARVQHDVYLYCSVAHLTLAGLGLPIPDMEINDPKGWEMSLGLLDSVAPQDGR